MDDPPFQFLLIAISSQAIGTLMSIVFICIVREKQLSIDSDHVEHAI
jgi:Na+/melibiose symporter-like transporter